MVITTNVSIFQLAQKYKFSIADGLSAAQRCGHTIHDEQQTVLLYDAPAIIRDVFEHPLKVASAYGTDEEFTQVLECAPVSEDEHQIIRTLIQSGLPVADLESITHEHNEVSEGVIVEFKSHAYQLMYHLTNSVDTSILTRYWKPLAKVIRGAKDNASQATLTFTKEKFIDPKEGAELVQEIDDCLDRLPIDSDLHKDLNVIKILLHSKAHRQILISIRYLVEAMCRDLYEYKTGRLAPKVTMSDLINTKPIENTMRWAWKETAHGFRIIGGQFAHPEHMNKIVFDQKIMEVPDRDYAQMVILKFINFLDDWRKKIPTDEWVRCANRMLIAS